VIACAAGERAEQTVRLTLVKKPQAKQIVGGFC
jgi:hypothetical protein